MRVVISTLSIVVAMGWAIVYFKFGLGGIVHLTLVIAIGALVTQWLPNNKP